MSVSSLPEWKQLLLEKKRREEEERGRREKEEEEKLASMPAWKRGIIQRRKAKQETLGDRERERDACLLQVEARSSSDGLSDTDSSVTINLGSELSLSPDPALWLDADLKPLSQVSLETIVPLHENPFIRTQSAWRRSKDADAGSEAEGNEREKEKSSPRGQDGESGRGQEIELKIERFRDLSEGREIDRCRDRSQGRERENSREGWEKEKSQWKEMVKDATREREVLKVRIEEEEKETDPPSGSAHVPCMRTIRADNIIIIEQDRTGGDERRGRWREAERETPDKDHREKRGMKMDLREILAGGGSVTEIRASEVLIIKPPVNPEEKNSASKGRENGEDSVDVRRESMNRDFRTDVSWLRDKDKERPWGQATVIKEDKKDSLDDNVFVERGGRVSQLLSKFGEHPKPPSRSKSSDNFLRPGRRKYSGDEDEQQSEERKADGRSLGWKGVPKRSFSFSDRALSAEENGLDEEGSHQRRTRQRIHSDKSVGPWGEASGSQEETREGIRLLYAQDADRLGKHRPVRGEPVQRSVSVQHRQDKRAAEKPGDADGDQGFTVASVRNTEGISFARRVPIKQEGRAKSERESRRTTGERSSERELSKDAETGGKPEAQLCNKVHEEGGFEEGSSSLEAVGACPAADASYKRESAFTESSSLLCTVTDRAREWSAAGPQAPYSSVLSQQTEDLISKIEKIGETTVYSNEKGERAYEAAAEARLEDYSAAASDGLNRDGPTRSPRKITPTSPLEIQIPRTVFYVAEETVERKTAACHSVEGPRWEGGRGVEKRDSWRVGKPLSRIESLREQIRQRELERLRQRRGDGGEAAERGGDPYDERGAEGETGREAHRKRPVEAEAVREDAGAAAFDVTQEAGVSKTCPQLPVSVSQSRAVAGEEATSRCAAAALDLSPGSSQASQDEDEPLKHEEQVRSHREEDRAEEAPTGEEAEELAAPASPACSPPSSPPHNSLAAMSRIYKLENAGSRSALCLRDRKADVPAVHLARVRPLASNAAQGDSEAPTGEDLCGVQTIQRQIEQFQLKEQEALKEQQSPRGGSKPRGKDGEQETAEPVPKMSPQRTFSPTPHNKQTITITASFLRGRPQDGSLKPTDCAPTPSSSPSSPSPAPSPSASPSPTPSPVPFSIRSASGGQVKRGATITITPRKPAAAGPTPASVSTGPTAPSVTAGPVPAKAPPPQAQTPPVMADARKRYPTVEEIEVIGGYQNLEKSCLVKNRVTPKKVNVCFDDEQLEQVCEYPSETSMLGCSPYPPDPARAERPQGGDAQEEEGEAEAEAAAVMSKSSRSAGMSSRGLRTILAQYRSQSPSPKLPM